MLPRTSKDRLSCISIEAYQIHRTFEMEPNDRPEFRIARLGNFQLRACFLLAIGRNAQMLDLFPNY
jgi:hypothetical protein